MAKEHVHGVFESIADGYDAANDRISLGMHNMWKQKLCNIALKTCNNPNRAGLVLDVCCGTGDITQMLAEEDRDVFVTGLDFSANMLNVARKRTAALDNIMLVEGNAMALPFDDDTFDAVVISFGLRNTPDYEQVVREMTRVVRPGGVVACLDASVPENGFIQPFYQFYYKYIMTLIGGGASHRKEYDWLYESTQEFLTKEELSELFRSCGLTSIQVRPFMFGAAALHSGVKPLFSADIANAVTTAVNQAAHV